MTSNGTLVSTPQTRTIDGIYKQVINKLTNLEKIHEASEVLFRFRSNDERTIFVHGLIEEFELFPQIIQKGKSLDLSTHYRNQGNSHFQKREYYEAWQYYNLSLMSSPPTTSNYVLAISNRSAILAGLKKYQECLNDIAYIFSLDYPENIKDKLVKRQKNCEEALQAKIKGEVETDEATEQAIADVLSLKGPRDSRYLCASAKLEVLYNEQMGRHVVAKENIHVGEILAEEDPYLKLLLKSQYLFSCAYCLSRTLNLYPCNFCCYTLYCSKDCAGKAWVEYHKVECPMMATLVKMEFTKLELLALRICIKARTGHSCWTGLFKCSRMAEHMMYHNLWGHMRVNKEWVYDSQYYTSIHSLATNLNRRTIGDLFQKCVSAAVILEMLNKGHFLKADNDILKLEIFRYVAGNLLRHMMTSPTNMHGISANVEDVEGNYIDEINIGSAPYAFLSLVNHSCSPNVVRYTKLGTAHMALIAIRPIKKGMQIFDNYGAHHALDDREERQQKLMFQYKFACLCEACVNDWPTYFNLRASDLPLSIARNVHKYICSDTITNLQKADKKTALKLYKPLCKLAQSLEPFAPCRELADCQECIKQCLAVFEGVVDHGYSKEIDWEIAPPTTSA